MSGCHPIMRALGAPGLTHAEARVFAYYVGRANGAKLCWPSIAEISLDLDGMPHRTIKEANRRLCEKGRITVQRRFQDSNHYVILDPDGWVYGPPTDSFCQGATIAPMEEIEGAKVAPMDDIGAAIAPMEGATIAPIGLDEGAKVAPLEVSEAPIGATIAPESKTQERKKEREESPPTPPNGGASAKRGLKPRRRTPLPEDWQPDEKSRSFAKDHNVDADLAREEFSNYWLSEGRPMADWQATFRNRVLALEERGRFRLATANRSNGKPAFVWDWAHS